MRKTTALAAVAGLAALGFAAANQFSIDLEGLPPGTIVSQLKTGQGISGNVNGHVSVVGYNPTLGAQANAAVIFDSANPTGGDVDLGTPNQLYNGPGIGAAGASNDTPLGHILIVAEDLVDTNPADGLVDDPDDADVKGVFLWYDFSTTTPNNDGTVRVDSVTYMDVEVDEGENGAFLELWGPNLPKQIISMPPVGDNGVGTIANIGLDGVSDLRVNLNGSGAVTAVIANAPKKTRDCWFTFGGFQNASMQAGPKLYTFGGNVGPPPSGSIQVNDHTTGAKFHSNNVAITSCERIPGTGPGQPGRRRGFDANKADFAGTGRLNGVPGYPFTGYVIDSGEPQGKKGNNPDFFEIVVVDPNNNNAVVFKASGNLDGGNVQLHPPVGRPQSP